MSICYFSVILWLTLFAIIEEFVIITALGNYSGGFFKRFSYTFPNATSQHKLHHYVTQEGKINII